MRAGFGVKRIDYGGMSDAFTCLGREFAEVWTGFRMRSPSAVAGRKLTVNDGNHVTRALLCAVEISCPDPVHFTQHVHPCGLRAAPVRSTQETPS